MPLLWIAQPTFPLKSNNIKVPLYIWGDSRESLITLTFLRGFDRFPGASALRQAKQNRGSLEQDLEVKDLEGF